MNIAARYNAECWSHGKTESEIKTEIQRQENMWTSKLLNPFPGSAHAAYSRIVTLREILNNRLTSNSQ